VGQRGILSSFHGIAGGQAAFVKALVWQRARAFPRTTDSPHELEGVDGPIVRGATAAVAARNPSDVAPGRFTDSSPPEAHAASSWSSRPRLATRWRKEGFCARVCCFAKAFAHRFPSEVAPQRDTYLQVGCSVALAKS
jgi:hypothetical protein